MLKNFKIIDTIINALLELDPESNHRLKKLAGKNVTIEILPFHFHLHCVFNKKGLSLKKKLTHPADTTITGTPLQMLGVMINKNNRHAFFADDMVIEGNAEVAQDVICLFDDLEIDWEDYLAQAAGDTPAYYASQFAHKVKDFFGNVTRSFSQNLNEYLHEEIECFPPREAIANFYNDIDTLRMDVDRAFAKIEKLHHRLANQGKHRE